MPGVSVVIPVYNVEEYIEECLESVKRQTLDDIEVILVNDGSTDGSRDIAKRFSDMTPDWILVDQENKGLSGARNAGMERATGKYIYFLDSDDVIADDALEKLFYRAEKDSLDILKFEARVFSGKPDGDPEDISDDYRYKGDYPKIYPGLDLLGQFFSKEDLIVTSWAMLIRREASEKDHIRFKEGILYEDNLFNFEIMSVSDRTAVLKEPLYYYRTRPGAITYRADQMAKLRSMSESALGLEEFGNRHPEVLGDTYDRQMLFFLGSVFECWEKLEPEQQDSDEIREIRRKLKDLSQKQKGSESTNLRLFYDNFLLLKLRRYMGSRIRRIMGKGQTV